MRNSLLITSALLVLMDGLSGPVAAADVAAPREFAGVRAELERLIETGAVPPMAVPSVAVAVVRDGEIVLAEGF